MSQSPPPPDWLGGVGQIVALLGGGGVVAELLRRGLTAIGGRGEESRRRRREDDAIEDARRREHGEEDRRWRDEMRAAYAALEVRCDKFEQDGERWQQKYFETLGDLHAARAEMRLAQSINHEYAGMLTTFIGRQQLANRHAGTEDPGLDAIMERVKLARSQHEEMVRLELAARGVKKP